MPNQSKWQYCHKCHVMFFDGYPDKGYCVAGAGHEAAGFEFIPAYSIPGTLSDQIDWRYCHKCHVMFYDGYPDKGYCIAGSGHEAAGYDFVLHHDDIPQHGWVQVNWRYCHKCHVLFYDGYEDKGQCAAGGGHEAAGYNFVLPRKPGNLEPVGSNPVPPD